MSRDNCGKGWEVSGEKWGNVVFLFIYLFIIIDDLSIYNNREYEGWLQVGIYNNKEYREWKEVYFGSTAGYIYGFCLLNFTKCLSYIFLVDLY